MPAEKPNPQQLTLRFKSHKTTILLLVAPHDSLTSIKAKLLEAMKVANISEIQGRPLPTTPDDVLLGVLIDSDDPGEGWTDLEIPEKEDDTHKKGPKKSSVLNASPVGAGVKDGSVLAFKFRTETSDADDLDMGDNVWDVVMPTFDDEEGSQMKEAKEGSQMEEAEEV
ncbi:MAG: hypothetical protein L6R38_000921 [Xanthoria sp. 2 TBL-2021]|nr:MAG: hypothetical protein L6R38_000921 [Xanthoria sp. 2 TBL-2021]